MKKILLLLAAVIALHEVSYAQHCTTCCDAWHFPVRECTSGGFLKTVCENCNTLWAKVYPSYPNAANPNEIYMSQRWFNAEYNGEPIPVVYDDNDTTTLPPGVTFQQLDSALHQAVNAWNSVAYSCCGGWEPFQFYGSKYAYDSAYGDRDPDNGSTNMITVGFTNSTNVFQNLNNSKGPKDWAEGNTIPDTNLYPGTGYNCDIYRQGSFNPPYEGLFDMHIFLDNVSGNQFDWVQNYQAGQDSAGFPYISIEDVIFHELGHTLGLVDLGTGTHTEVGTGEVPNPGICADSNNRYSVNGDDPNSVMWGSGGTRDGVAGESGPDYNDSLTRFDKCYFMFTACGCDTYENNISTNCDADVKQSDLVLPPSSLLLKTYPNPVTEGDMAIDFSTSDEGFLTVEIYNITGEKVGTAFRGFVPDNSRLVLDYSISTLTSGEYICTVKENNKQVKYSFVVKR